MPFKSVQEEFWAGAFGDEYMTRNAGERELIIKLFGLGKMLRSAHGIRSIMELGCNIGLNLAALKQISPKFELSAYEINPRAADAARALGVAEITTGSIVDNIGGEKRFDLVFTSGVLIHVQPNFLDVVYRNLVGLSNRYILVNEYYSPTPISVDYRGEKDKLFKRDFAGELIDKFNLELVDYGFLYHRDNYFPAGDSNWFLLEKHE